MVGTGWKFPQIFTYNFPKITRLQFTNQNLIRTLYPIFFYTSSHFIGNILKNLFKFQPSSFIFLTVFPEKIF